MTSYNYHFDWSEDVNCSFTKEDLVSDSLNRSHQAEYLTHFTRNYKAHHYVLNLNSDWGAGKSYFLKRWANSIKEHHPVVYFDAWSNDYHNDPLILVVSHIINALNKLCENKGYEKLLENVNKSTGILIKNVSPNLLNDVIKKYTGADFRSYKNEFKEELKKDDNISGLALELLDATNKQKEAVEHFKKAISILINQVVEEENNDEKHRWSPMYVFIDELDRCRPTFAIEILETIKHIFSIDKVIFIVATDSKQLEHSIKTVYGQGFDSRKYLERFFNRSFTLSKPSLSLYINTLIGMELIINKMVKGSDQRITWSNESVVHFISTVFECLSLDLRTASQIVDRVSSIIAYSGSGIVLWVIILESLRSFDYEIYQEILTGEIKINNSTFHSKLMNVVKKKAPEKKFSNESLFIDGESYSFSSLLLYISRKYSGEVEMTNKAPTQIEYYLNDSHNQKEIRELMELSYNIK